MLKRVALNEVYLVVLTIYVIRVMIIIQHYLFCMFLVPFC